MGRSGFRLTLLRTWGFPGAPLCTQRGKSVLITWEFSPLQVGPISHVLRMILQRLTFTLPLLLQGSADFRVMRILTKVACLARGGP